MRRWLVWAAIFAGGWVAVYMCEQLKKDYDRHETLRRCAWELKRVERWGTNFMPKVIQFHGYPWERKWTTQKGRTGTYQIDSELVTLTEEHAGIRSLRKWHIEFAGDFDGLLGVPTELIVDDITGGARFVYGPAYKRSGRRLPGSKPGR